MARVPRQIDLSDILSEQNPHIDLRIEIYENSTRNFLKAISNFKNQFISQISERRAHQANEKKKILERTQTVEAETNACKLREIALVADLEREKEERKDAELSVAAFKRQLSSLRERCTAVEGEIEQYRAITMNLRRERDNERSTLSTHASRVSPELDACQRALACIIEGIGNDQLLVRFFRIDSADPQREFSFVIDVSNEVYKVITTSPALPSLPILVDELNTSRDIYLFIKRVRNAYQELVQASR